MKEIKAAVYLTIELRKMMKIHYMRNSVLPDWEYVRDYLYTSAGENINMEEYPEYIAGEVYENMVSLKQQRNEIW
jgi:nicotinamide riboside kinase